MDAEDHGGFVPPDAGPPRPPVEYSTVYPAPPPVGSPAGRSKPRRWIIPVVVAGVLVAAGLVYGVIALATAAADFLSRTVADNPSSVWEPPDPIVGDPGSPVAREPVDCPGDCYTGASVAGFVPTTRSLEELGLPNVTAPYGYYATISASEFYDSLEDQWDSGGGQPEACFFAISDAPVSTVRGGPDAAGEDSVYFLGTYEDDNANWLNLDVRLFEDSRSAEAFTIALSEQVERCDEYSVDYGQGPYTAALRPLPDLGVPASIGVAGWVERDPAGGAGFIYVAELQRSNAVIQCTFASDESITEAQFRRFLNWFAAQVAAVQPH